MLAVKFMHWESSSWSHRDSSCYIKATQQHRLCRIKACICTCKSTPLWKAGHKFYWLLFFFSSSSRGSAAGGAAPRLTCQGSVEAKCDCAPGLLSLVRWVLSCSEPACGSGNNIPTSPFPWIPCSGSYSQEKHVIPSWKYLQIHQIEPVQTQGLQTLLCFSE